MVEARGKQINLRLKIVAILGPYNIRALCAHLCVTSCHGRSAYFRKTAFVLIMEMTGLIKLLPAYLALHRRNDGDKGL